MDWIVVPISMAVAGFGLHAFWWLIDYPNHPIVPKRLQHRRHTRSIQSTVEFAELYEWKRARRQTERKLWETDHARALQELPGAMMKRQRIGAVTDRVEIRDGNGNVVVTYFEQPNTVLYTSRRF